MTRGVIKSKHLDELKRKRRKLLYVKLSISAFVFVALVVGLVFLSRTNNMTISEINISGNSVITNDEISGIVQDSISGNYLFFFPKKIQFSILRKK